MASEWDVVSSTPVAPDDDWSVLKTEAATPAKTVETPKKPQRSITDEALRQLGLFTRMGVGGVSKAFTYPVRAVGSAVAGGLYQAGAKDAARYAEHNFGVEGGDTALDTVGLPKPENKTERVLQAAGEGMTGGTVGNVVGLAGKAPAAVKALLPSSSGPVDVAVNAGVSAGMEHDPTATLGVGGALAAAALLKKSAQALPTVVSKEGRAVKRAEKLFADSPTPFQDAQIVKELSERADDPLKFNQVNGKQQLTRAASMNGAAKNDINAVKQAMQRAGIKDPDIMTVLSKSEPSLEEINSIRGTPAGDAAADALVRAQRIAALTAPKQSNALLSAVRAGVDYLPIPPVLAPGIKATLGGRQTREDAFNKLVTPKNVAAADALLAQPRASYDTSRQSFGILSQLADDKMAQRAVPKVKASGKGILSDFDIVENAIQKRKQAEYDAAIKEVDAGVKEAQALKQKQADALNKQVSKDPSLLVPDARDPKTFSPFSKLIRQQMEDRIKQEQMSKGAAKEAQEAAAAEALKIKSRQMSRTPGGGAYQALLEHTGLSKEDLNQALRIAENIPEASKAVRAIRVDGSNTAKDAIYPVTDIVKSIADRMGMQRTPPNNGILSQTQGSGVLSGVMRDNSGVQIRSPNLYTSKIDANQARYLQDAKDLAASDLPSVVKKTALDVNKVLKTTGDDAKRQAAIQEMLNKHPEYATNLLAIFKPYMK